MRYSDKVNMVADDLASHGAWVSTATILTMFTRNGQGWGLLSQFPPFRYFPIFFSIVKPHVSYWISRLYLAGVAAAHAAAVTPVKYGCDSKNLTCAFARSKILLTEKLTNGALVTPTPGLITRRVNTLGPRQNGRHFADKVQPTIFQHWFRYWLATCQPTSHYLNQWWLVYRRIYMRHSLGLSELKITHNRCAYILR